MALQDDRPNLRLRGLLSGVLAALVCDLSSRTTQAAPASADPDGPYVSCSLMLGQEYVQSPLPGFDPADTTKRLAAPSPELNAQSVLCIRTAIVPALYDYRVLTEMRLPLFIRATGRIVALDAPTGRLRLRVIDGAALSQAEDQAVGARLAQMETALQAASRGPAAPQVDLAKAYSPADYALLQGIIAKAGVPQNLDFFARQMGASGGLAGCPPGTEAAFAKTMASHLYEQRAQFQSDMASGFDPPFTHDELVALVRFYQLTPILIAPTTTSLPKANPLSAAEKAEADALAKTPGVVRFVKGFAKAMAPMMEHLGRLGTTTLHETCPAKKDAQIRSTGLQSEIRGAGSPFP